MKRSYGAFRIAADDIPTIILFAGVRFALCGAGLAIISAIRDKKIVLPSKKEAPHVVLGTLFTVILQYSFIYIALAVGDSSKSAIIKQVGFLFLSCFSFLFLKSDRFTLKKALCGMLGFLGIIVTNFEGSFTFAIGDALILAASFSAVVGTVLTKKAVARVSPVKLVAYSQLIGGVVLCIFGLVLGGRLSYLDMRAALAMLYICLASILGYVLWNVVIQYHSVSKLSVIRFSIPLFSVVFSGILLHEEVFRFNYILALCIIFAAILLNSISPKEKKK
jgi:drug/metabolite transporter (DMT)-like permease